MASSDLVQLSPAKIRPRRGKRSLKETDLTPRARDARSGQACAREAATELTTTGVWPDLKSADGPIDVIDLFAGCGGLSAGFAAVGAATRGFRLAGAADLSEPACETYATNFGLMPARCDLGAVSEWGDLTRKFVHSFPLNPTARRVVVGGPPCQGFSSHSKRNKNHRDERNSLVGAFARLAVALEPEAVVMENVPELLSGQHWRHFDEFRTVMKQHGYVITAEIHNLATFGVPQERIRATVIARKGASPRMPRAVVADHEFRTVRHAIGHLRSLQPGVPDSDDPMHVCASHRESTIAVIRQVPKDGGTRPKGVGPASVQKVDGFRDVYGRLAWDRPANTITHYARNPASGRFSHPVEDRGLSLREAALLQSFPGTFVFNGGFDDRFSQVGNAVPPLYAAHIAAAVLDDLMDCACGTTDRADEVAGVSRTRHLVVNAPQRDSFSSGLISMKARAVNL